MVRHTIATASNDIIHFSLKPSFFLSLSLPLLCSLTHTLSLSLSPLFCFSPWQRCHTDKLKSQTADGRCWYNTHTHSLTHTHIQTHTQSDTHTHSLTHTHTHSLTHTHKHIHTSCTSRHWVHVPSVQSGAAKHTPQSPNQTVNA